MKHFSLFSRFLGVSLSLAVFVMAPCHLAGGEAAQVFATPEEAVAALTQATGATNRAALARVLGAESERLVNPDEVQGTAEMAEFTAAFQVSHRLLRPSESRRVLEVGTNRWPFPIPLVKVAAGWQFDTAAGLEELLNRRIGRNELDVLRVVRAYVQAQREYASRDRDGDGVLEYARKIGASPGTMDGLYWPPDFGGEISPLGPLMAYAQGEGYAMEGRGNDQAREPFHGYYVKILTRQGRHAPGGKYDYVINGNMIAGFGLVAWPAEYGASGVMSFIVNQQGKAYQQDLGKNTARTAQKLRAYDPGPGWQVSLD
jgi:hypothetical protein